MAVVPALHPIRFGSSPEGTPRRPLILGGASGSGGGDPYWDNVVLLLSGNGPNNSTTFTDESPHLHGDAAVLGNVHVSTASSCVDGETGSGTFDGSSANLSYADNPDWTFDDKIFTVEARIKPASLATFGFIVGHWGNLDIFNPSVDLSWAFYQTSAAIGFAFSNSGIDFTLFDGGTMVAGECCTVAASSDGATIWLYLNGVVVASHAAPSVYANATKRLAIGSNSETNSPDAPSFFYNGTQNELRITKSIDRYGGVNYTPTNIPYPRFGS